MGRGDRDARVAVRARTANDGNDRSVGHRVLAIGSRARQCGLVYFFYVSSSTEIYTAKSANALGQSILMNMPEKCDQKVCTNVVLVV